jgi:hypothetical protein
MPTLLTEYSGSFGFMATHAICGCFILLAIGPFLEALGPGAFHLCSADGSRYLIVKKYVIDL